MYFLKFKGPDLPTFPKLFQGPILPYFNSTRSFEQFPGVIFDNFANLRDLLRKSLKVQSRDQPCHLRIVGGLLLIFLYKILSRDHFCHFLKVGGLILPILHNLLVFRLFSILCT